MSTFLITMVVTSPPIHYVTSLLFARRNEFFSAGPIYPLNGLQLQYYSVQVDPEIFVSGLQL